MATWENDELRELNRALAGALLGVSQVCDLIIEKAYMDDDLTLYIDTRDRCRDRANLFSPPGEPQDGYPQEEGGAEIINLDAWREWQKIQTG